MEGHRAEEPRRTVLEPGSRGARTPRGCHQVSASAAGRDQERGCNTGVFSKEGGVRGGRPASDPGLMEALGSLPALVPEGQPPWPPSAGCVQWCAQLREPGHGPQTACCPCATDKDAAVHRGQELVFRPGADRWAANGAGGRQPRVGTWAHSCLPAHPRAAWAHANPGREAEILRGVTPVATKATASPVSWAEPVTPQVRATPHATPMFPVPLVPAGA